MKFPRAGFSICIWVTALLTILLFNPKASFAQGNNRLVWEFQTGAGYYGVRSASSPAIGSDGTVYVVTGDRNLYAINPDGSEKWHLWTGHPDNSPAIGSDGTVYVGTDNSILYAINPDGSEKWHFWTGAPARSSPAIGSDGTVYVGSGDSNLYAINPDGSEKWRFQTGSGAGTPAIGSDGTVYVGSGDRNLYAINPDGSEKWRFQTGGSAFSPPAIGSDGTVYVGSGDYYAGSGDNNLYAINPDGSEKWRFQTDTRVWGSPAIGSDGTIYVGSFTNNLYVINPDGSEKWRGHAKTAFFTSPLIGSDGTVYVGTGLDAWLADGGILLYAFDPNLISPGSPERLVEKWYFQTGEVGVLGQANSSPAIDNNGILYITEYYSGRVYAINTGTGAGLDSGPWPKFQRNEKNTGLFQVPSPEITLSDTAVAIAETTPDSSNTGTFTITNDGSSPLVVSSIASDNPVFAVNPDSVTLAPGISQVVTVTFTPADTGTQSATITIISNDSDEGTVTVTVSGLGTAPEIAFSTTSVDIGDVDLGSSGSGGFTILNEGNGDLVVSSITSDDSVFTIDTVRAVIGPLDSLAVLVAFTPVDTGAQSAIITVESNDSDEATFMVTVSGRGTAPEITLSATAVDLGSVGLGASASGSFTILNEGSGELVVSSIASDNPVFTLDASSASISAGDGLAVGITFTPLALGQQSAVIAISSNDADEAVVNVTVSASASIAYVSIDTTLLNDFILFSLDDTGIKNDAVVSGGNIGSNGDLEIGVSSYALADLSVAGDLKLKSRATVEGDITLGGKLKADKRSVITGSVTQAPVAPVTFSVDYFSAGVESIEIKKWESVELPPGSYGELKLKSDAVLSLSSGSYYFSSLDAGSKSRLELDLSDGPLFVYLVEDMKFGTKSEISISSITGDTSQVFFIIKGDAKARDDDGDDDGDDDDDGKGKTKTSKSTIGMQAHFLGTVIAPTSKIEVNEKAEITGALYAYKLEIKGKTKLIFPGSEQAADDGVLLASSAFGISSPELPKAFALSQNNPNPFNPSTSISYSVPENEQGLVSLKVFDLRGRLVKTLVNTTRTAGSYQVFWDGTNQSGQEVASGIYLYRLQAGEYTRTRKMVLLK